MFRRLPHVAGTFYESDREKLMSQIEWCFMHELGPGKLPSVPNERRKLSLGFVVPHAGYIYSGPVAAHAYYGLASEGVPETVIVIGPNHTGIGTAVATMVEGVWETPLGEVPIDEELAKKLVKESSYLDIDVSALLYEHSIEVQLPFLQYIYDSKIKFVPIAISLQLPEVARDLALAIRRAVGAIGRDIVLIATTDWTHYEPQEIAYEKDREGIKRVLSIDPEGLFRVIEEKGISACGYGAVAVLLYLAKSYGVKSAELLKYATSGDITGRRDSVVGYASIRVPIS